ncbi:MAG: hypothetical protein ACFFBV_00065 [Promethearchaeota archaeon]
MSLAVITEVLEMLKIRFLTGKESREGIYELPSTKIFNCKDIFLLSFGFVLIMISSNNIVKFIGEKIVEFDCPYYWPMSEFNPRIPDWKQLLLAMAVLGLFQFVITQLPKVRNRISFLIIVGIILVLGTNLIQGWEDGFLTPISGGGEEGGQYYHDAIKIEEPLYFLGHFEEIQPGLLTHSRTHPPGAVLLIYFLSKILKDPALISFVIAGFAVFFTMLFLNGILSTQLKEDDLSKYMTFLFLLIPSVQIYYAASIDALIASFLLGVLFFFIYSRLSVSVIGSVIFLLLSSSLSFGFVSILPVILGIEILRGRFFWRSCLVLMGLTVIYLIVFFVTDFNYINSFIIASTIENPHGFRFFSDPISYVFTRIEGIFEIILFLGPFLAVAVIRGMSIVKESNSNLLTMTYLSIVTLLAMLLTGCFRTGETARACLFIYPYLLFPIAIYFQHIRISTKEKSRLLYLVFSQTMLMQMFGNYFW